MNERIKQLAEQADITLVPTEFTGCLSGQDFLVTDRNITGKHLEKFAELIVKECVMVADEHDCNLSGNGGEILKHFGVEQ